MKSEKDLDNESLVKKSPEGLFELNTKDKDRKSTTYSSSETRKGKSIANSLCSMLRMSFPGPEKKDNVQDSESNASSNPFQPSSEQYYVETSQEAKLADRESAIRSLEETIEHHVKAMHTMQAEMDCMVETLKMKEKKNQATHLQKEKFFGEQLSNLEQNIKKRDKLAASQEKQIV